MQVEQPAVVTDDFEVESTGPSEAELRKDLGLPAEDADEKAVAAKGDNPAPKGDKPAADEPEKGDNAEPERDEHGRFKAKDGDEKAEKVEAKPDAKAKDEKPAKPRNDPQARINQALERQRLAEERAQAAEARARELEARGAKPDATPEAKPTQAEWKRYKALPDAPKETEFDDYGDYSAALSLFIADKRFEDREQARRQEARAAHVDRERRTLEDAFAAQVDKAVANNPEWLSTIAEDVLNLPTFAQLRKGERPMAKHFIGEELLRAENKTGLMQYLSDHLDEFQALASLPPRAITRQMAIYEARLDAAATGTARTAPPLSQAKPPIRPVIGSPTASADEPPDPDDLDLDSHIRFYNAQDRKGSGRR